eukprot:COSAG05_NODE_311_length_11636_cov_11.922250_2_plen_223_part_00
MCCDSQVAKKWGAMAAMLGESSDTCLCSSLLTIRYDSVRFRRFVFLNRCDWLSNLAVTVINQVLKRTIKGTAHHLKAHTLEEEMAYKSSRVFFCQLANTAVLMLLLTSEFGVRHTHHSRPVSQNLRHLSRQNHCRVSQPFTRIPGAHYGNINPEWYAAIGAPMVATMAFQFVTYIGMDVCYTAPISWLTRTISGHRASTQVKPSRIEPVQHLRARIFHAFWV